MAIKNRGKRKHDPLKRPMSNLNVKFAKDLVSAIKANSDPIAIVMAHSQIVSKSKLTLLICGCLNHFKHLPNINPFVDELRDEEILDENLLLEYLDDELQVSLELSASKEHSFKYPPFIVELPWLTGQSNLLFDQLNSKVESVSLDLPNCTSGELYVFIDFTFKHLQPLTTLHSLPYFFNCGLSSSPVRLNDDTNALYCTKAMFLFVYWISKGIVDYDNVYALLLKYSNPSPVSLSLSTSYSCTSIGLPDPSIAPNDLSMYHFPSYSQELLDLLDDIQYDEFLDPKNNSNDKLHIDNRNAKISNLKSEFIKLHQKPINLQMSFLQSSLALLPLSTFNPSQLQFINQFTPLYHIHILRYLNLPIFINMPRFELQVSPTPPIGQLPPISTTATTPLLFKLYSSTAQLDKSTTNAILPHLVCYPQFASHFYALLKSHAISPNDYSPLSQFAIKAHVPLMIKLSKSLISSPCKEWDQVNQLCHSHFYYHAILYNQLLINPNMATFVLKYLKGDDTYYQGLFQTTKLAYLENKNKNQNAFSLGQLLVLLLLKTNKCDVSYFKFITNHPNVNNLHYFFTTILQCTDTTYKRVFHPYLTRLPNMRYFIYSQCHLNRAHSDRPIWDCLLNIYQNVKQGDPTLFDRLINQLISTVDASDNKNEITEIMVVLEDLMTWLYMNDYKYIPNTHVVHLYLQQKQFIDPLNAISKFDDLINKYMNTIKHRLSPALLAFIEDRILLDKQYLANQSTMKLKQQLQEAQRRQSGEEPLGSSNNGYCTIFNLNDAYYHRHSFDIGNCGYLTEMECLAVGVHYKNTDMALELINENTREILHVLLTMVDHLEKADLVKIVKKQKEISDQGGIKLIKLHLTRKIKMRLKQLGHVVSDAEMNKWLNGKENEIFNEMGIKDEEEEEGEIKQMEEEDEMILDDIDQSIEAEVVVSKARDENENDAMKTGLKTSSMDPDAVKASIVDTKTKNSAAIPILSEPDSLYKLNSDDGKRGEASDTSSQKRRKYYEESGVDDKATPAVGAHVRRRSERTIKRKNDDRHYGSSDSKSRGSSNESHNHKRFKKQ